MYSTENFIRFLRLSLIIKLVSGQQANRISYNKRIKLLKTNILNNKLKTHSPKKENLLFAVSKRKINQKLSDSFSNTTIDDGKLNELHKRNSRMNCI